VCSKAVSLGAIGHVGVGVDELGSIGLGVWDIVCKAELGLGSMVKVYGVGIGVLEGGNIQGKHVQGWKVTYNGRRKSID
jgi:hypothetical protein